MCLHVTSEISRTVYPKKYAHGFCFAVLCCGYTLTYFPNPSGLLHWHCGNLTVAPVPAKQPWLIWINTSCEFIMNDCITTTKQSTTKPCAYFLGYIVPWCHDITLLLCYNEYPNGWGFMSGWAILSSTQCRQYQDVYVWSSTLQVLTAGMHTRALIISLRLSDAYM